MIGGNERRGRKCKISTAYRRNSRVFNALNWEPFLGLRRMHGTIENASEKERRKGNAEREPGAIAIQYGPDDLHLYLAIKRPRDYSHGPARILLSLLPGSPLLSRRTARGFPSSSRKDLVLCRRPADDTDRDNNIVTLSLHAQPTHSPFPILLTLDAN